MIVSSHQVLLSLLIGAEVFVIAALWPLSGWAAMHRHGAWFVVALAIIATCFGMDAFGPGLAMPDDVDARWAPLLRDAVLPLFMALPAAVCVASAESLVRAGVARRTARMTALAVGALAVVMTPFAALVAGCGVAGACF